MCRPGRIVSDHIKTRLSKVIENGENAYHQFRQERCVLKSKSLSVTILKVNLPQFDSGRDEQIKSSPNQVQMVSAKDITAAQRDIDIAKECVMTTMDIFSYDILLHYSPLLW